MPSPERPDRPARTRDVWTLVVEVGRAQGDGLPEGATGAALLCYSAGVSEKEAVDEAVALLRQADLAPLEVASYGALGPREAAGEEIFEEDRALMLRALDENAVVVAQVTPFFGDEAEEAE